MLLAGGCGSSAGRPAIEKTGHLKEAYEFGRNIYEEGSGSRMAAPAKET